MRRFVVLAFIVACSPKHAAAPMQSTGPVGGEAAPAQPAAPQPMESPPPDDAKSPEIVAVGGGGPAPADPCEGGEIIATSNKPTVGQGPPQSNGSIDKTIIRTEIKKHLAAIKFCYEKELLSDPKVEGTVRMKFLIGAQGKVTSVTASGINATIEACLVKVFEKMQFPATPGGGAITVAYPLVFRPST